MTDKIEKMTEDDFKKIMKSLGMPDSMSLYAALKQVENHTWQAAQSVHVLGPPVAWVNINKHGDATRTVSRRDNWCTTPVFVKPKTSIQAAELARLREKAAMADELQKRAERMQKALSDIAEWTDRYTTPGHPVSTIARAAIAQEPKK